MKNEVEVYDLTAPQKSILFTEQFYSGTNINNICGTAIIDSVLDFDILKKAVNIFVENNDSFQLKLILVENEMKQFKEKFTPFDVEIVNLDSKNELAILENKIISHHFDVFNNENLYIIKLFKFKNGSGGFTVNVHHLISDSWTLGILSREIVRIYSCLMQDNLDEDIKRNDEFSYINYITSEKEYINSPKFKKDKEYWNSVFDTVPEPVTIPANASLTNSNNNISKKSTVADNFSCSGERCSFNISNDKMKKINTYCKNNGFSVFNFFMAIYSLYISRITNSNDFVIGTPILNRTNFKEKNTTGMFINIAPLRININNSLDFKSFVLDIAKDSMAMLRHQKYSYQYILEDLRKKDISLPNLYNIVLSYQITNATDSTLPYETTWSFNGNCADDIDIHFYDINNCGNIIIAYDYKISKYTKADIEGIHCRAMHIIEQILNNSNICLNNIDIITNSEKTELLENFNNTKLNYDETKPLISYFEKQVDKTPNATALTFEGTEMKYKTLNEKANSLAFELRKNSITNNSIVGIMVNRSFEMIISILAVLKAGAAYIPIDPEYPIDRINYMLKDSKATAVLTTKNIKDRFELSEKQLDNLNSNKEINCNKVIYVDIDSSIYNEHKDNLVNISKPTDLSYIIYTSGSTGKPKGVMLTQKNLSNFYQAMLNKIEYLQNDKQYSIISITTVSFDIFGFETLISLTNGLNVYLTNYYEQKITNKLEKLIHKNNIDIIQTTPSVMRFHLDNLNNKDNFSNLKYVMLAGEQLPKTLVNRIKEIAPNCVIYNGYGPSETTIFSSVADVTNLEEINIGKPIANTQIYILDNNMNLLPKHHVGEIYISGDGVGNGYLYKQELTNANFLPNPFNNNSLLYKTGDLGLWLDNGCIECKGRIDNQVKLHGLRIELGEIENKINSFAKDNSLKSAVIIKHENDKDYICAFIEINSQSNISKIDTTSLKTYLLKLLPNYMIPTYFIQVDKLPQTPNGKTDRKALMKYNISIKNKDIIKPNTDTEKKLFELVSGIINNSDFSMADDLFAIGMDSLNIINLSSKIMNMFNIEISIKQLYSITSLSKLAKLIDERNVNCNIEMEKNGNYSYTIKKAIKKDYYNISSAQKRVYLACKIAGDNSITYNMPATIIFEELPDLTKLKKCFEKLIQRHSNLRTYFEVVEGKIYQKILPDISFDIDKITEKNKSIDEIINDFIKPFDLSKAPLFRIRFVTTKDKYILLFDMHHIICDGLSLNILITELCKLYNSENLENLLYEYIDYAEWEFNQLNSNKYNESKQFWTNQFKNDIPILDMPTDYQRPSVQTFNGSKIQKVLSDELIKKLDNLAKNLDVSNYMIFLSTYYILLSKYSNQEDIVVGTPVVGRNREEFLNMFGMFVNSLPLKAHINNSTSFIDFLNIIKSNCIQALEHQLYPFDELVNNLNITRDSSRNPLFDTMFTYQNNGFTPLYFGKIKTNYYIPDTKIAKFDLSLEFVPNTNTLTLEYRTDLYKHDTINRFLNCYINLLNNIIENLDTKIGDISILSNKEKNKILNEFNNTILEYPKNNTITQLFENQVKKSPNSIAVVLDDKKLTYKQLNEKANKLATLLINNGVKQQDTVGVMLPRSIELIISIFAILKCGAIYMPLYTGYPDERINYMLQNSNSKLVITNNIFAEKINDTPTVIFNDFNELNCIETYSKISISPNNIAYIIYTSGSTGKPKGVQITHDCLNNFIHSCKEYFKNISIEDNFLSSTNISFDVSIFELFLPLLCGAKLVLYHQELIKDIVDYCDYIEKHKITGLYIPPNILNEVYSILKDKNNIKINKLLVGVEAIKKTTLDKYLLLNPNMCILNGYGPTETTICCTILPYEKNMNFDTEIVSIGKPLYNNHIYILDNNKNIQPIGVVGELYVTGSGVGAGYINNDIETQKNYINNTFDNTSNKMYKTGDLGKWNIDGTITLIGRKDNQVKISGYRIELKEIDNIIMSYLNITKSITIVIDNLGKKSLISYFSATETIKIEELINYLNKKLPFYMIPEKLIQLPKFPITSNGKIDTKALPIPKFERETKYVPPKNEIQKKLCSIWSDLFNIDKIGIYDNFFNIGGDSLLSIKLVTKIYNQFNIKVGINEIFNKPTIKELSELINSISNIDKNKMCINKYPKREYYPVSSAQKRMYLASSVDNETTLYNITGGILLDSMPDINKLENVINTIITRHNSLRTYFEIIEGNIVQKILDNLNVKIDIIETNISDTNKLFKMYQSIFNLNKAPLFKILLFKLPNNKVLLMLDVHHIIFDGYSLNNLIQEISTLYNNNNNKLPTLNISYTDFAIWEEEQLLKNTFIKSKEFWNKQFSNDIPILNLPTTYARPANKNYEGDTYITTLSEELTKKINSFASKYNVTPYILMLCTYYILLYKYTGQEDIVIGSPVSGRIYEELSNLLGMFVNSLPIRNTVSANLNFEEFLTNIKKSCLDAFEHQDYPFDMLVNDINIPKDNSRNPLFDTMFIYQNNAFGTINFDGINTQFITPMSTTSKFDISVEIVPMQEGIKMSFEYCTKLFSKEFINNFSKHYINILNIILDNPKIEICNISILEGKEKEKILYDFNNIKMDYPKDKTIINLFEEQVEKTPNNIALIFEDKKLTYKELNEKSNQLAHYLQKQNIGKESIVGIMLPRSLEVLIAMLGVLKTGASYIPIDPTLPNNRINYMLTNSSANILLTTNESLNDIVIDKVLNVMLNNNIVYSGDCNNLNLSINNKSCSYIIYTSGSTGTPKGVVLNHKALINLATYLNNTVEFLKDEYANIAMASITTISFDIFIFETLICLQRGLKIIIANEAEQNSPNLLDELIKKHNVKAIQMTPSRMYIFINNKNLMPNLGQLKYIVLAGEALPKDLLNSILELGNIKVYNGYGPSETTVFATFTDVTNYDSITIGKPIANTRIYILDKDKNICPIGNPGEIYISGNGVGIGYCNNEEITKERFIQDIFYPQEIMYKTGDLAKYLPNGEIHYIGRIDNQIKIRGLRIELDEIENCIVKYPNIEKCIITADSDDNNRQFIVAYLCVNDRISINKLRMFLKTMLPKYMIPSYFIILDKIPYLNNGKINKKALPKPEIKTSSLEKTYVAPTNKIEIQLINIFQSLLSISPIGINDNFFELGGDSLIAINLQVELLKLNFNITYSDIFMNPTVKELANKLSTNEKSKFDNFDTNEFIKFNTILENNCTLPKKLKQEPIKNIIISGTTGFLGAHVLDAFLKQETGIAYCLIRREPGLTLENKLINKLHFYFGNKYDNYIGNRIIIVNSDIKDINLGLSTNEIENLANNISCVINCAAKVSHYGNYNDYKAVNIIGTENLLKFCMQYNKRFYQISTLSVSGNSLVDQSYMEQSFENDVIYKENNFYINQTLDNIYVRSKFEAEKLVLQYILNGLNGYICRVGNLMNRYTDAKFQPNVDENAYIGKLISLSNVGSIPDYMLNAYMEFTPIDSCAEAIIKLIQYPNNTNRIFHLYDHNHVDVIDFINVLKKYISFDIISNEEFINKINNIFKQKDSNKILSGILRDFDVNQKLVYESKVKLNSDFTIQYLNKIGFNWPKIDEIYIKKFIEYFCSLGYINKEGED